ncbi:MAG: ImmA/IrrE family metallo-endopeptidase [Lachnospiraceae bacterium]|nr:ImmA/IrrE family metallo-endopeptidase [Lachnospiraceae bacterium]
MFKEKYIPIIMQEIEKIRKIYNLNLNAPICDYIFVILKNECILLEWPEDRQLDLDGLSTEKVIGGRLETIVYINSAKSKEKQNFCAAHELGHRHKLDIQIKDAFPDDIITNSMIEDVMNRFAAELMMPARTLLMRL